MQKKTDYLIKSLDIDQKTYFCLSQTYYPEFNKEIQGHFRLIALPCINDKLNISKMIWNWENNGEITYNEENKEICEMDKYGNEIEDQIFDKINTKKLKIFKKEIYPGLCLCCINDRKRKWVLDEFGRIVNSETKHCLLVSGELEKFGDIYGKKIKIVDCLINDYGQNVTWLKSVFTNEDYNNVKLKIDIQTWTKNKQNLPNLFKKNQYLKNQLSIFQQEKINLLAKLKNLNELANNFSYKLTKYMTYRDQLINSDKNIDEFQNNEISNINGLNLKVFSNVALLEDTETNNFLIDKPILSETEKMLILSEKKNTPFSVRYISFLNVEFSGFYVFKTTIECGGVRLKINNNNVINVWDAKTSDDSNSDSIYLSSDRFYEIILEYFTYNPKNSFLTLEWQSPSNDFSIIPTNRLFLSSNRFYDYHIPFYHEILSLSSFPYKEFNSINKIKDIRNISHEIKIACEKRNENKAGPICGSFDIPKKGGIFSLQMNLNSKINTPESFLKNLTNSLIDNNLQDKSNISKLLLNKTSPYFIGFISNIRLSDSNSSAENLQNSGFETFKINNNEYYNLYYKRRAFEFEAPYINEFHLSCDIKPTLFSGFETIYSSTRSFSISFSRSTLKSNSVYFSNAMIWLSKNRDDFPFLLNNSNWNVYQCFSQQDNNYISLILKTEIYKVFNELKPINFFANCDSKFENLKNNNIVLCNDQCNYIENESLNTLYIDKDNICLEAYKYGLINNFGGIVKIEILITKNNNKKYFFDSYFGLNFNYITIPTHIKENYEIKPISMVQLDETISLKSNLKLNNIPIDALSRISEMMNLNGKAIARQNYNMKELESENQAISLKISQLENGDNGLNILKEKVEKNEEFISELKQQFDNLLNSNSILINAFSKRSDEMKLNNIYEIESPMIYIEKYDEPILKNWKIFDLGSSFKEGSYWTYLFLENQNKSVLVQNNEVFSSGLNNIGSQLISKMKITNNGYFKFSFKFREKNMFAIIYQIDSKNDGKTYDQILFNPMKKNKFITLQNIRNNEIVNETYINIDSKGINQIGPEWNSVYLLLYNEMIVLKLNEIVIYKGNREMKNNWFFGFSVFLSYSPYFDNIEIGRISLNKETELIILESLNTKEENKNSGNSKKEEPRFLEKKLNENNNQKISENSIENIKLICLYYNGVEEACTKAMIVYDEIITNHGIITEDYIARNVYGKCLNISENSVLGCSFAYKKALEIYKKTKE